MSKDWKFSLMKSNVAEQRIPIPLTAMTDEALFVKRVDSL